jgi:hypothetical protein
MQRGLAADLNGRVVIDYRPDGVVCTIDARLSDVPDPPEFGAPLARERRNLQADGAAAGPPGAN